MQRIGGHHGFTLTLPLVLKTLTPFSGKFKKLAGRVEEAMGEENTVATRSFRTAERSLWENGYFENSPKIEFSSDENDFWTGGS
jgi:hypothetical protein